jgi:protein arginine phosphatase
MAEALLKHYGKDTHDAKSAGVFAMPGESASKNAIVALENKGINFNHSSQPISEDLLQWSSNVLTMTNSHKHVLVSQFPQYKDKVFTIHEYVSGENRDISDPYSGSLTVYENTLNELEELIKQVIQKHE